VGSTEKLQLTFILVHFELHKKVSGENDYEDFLSQNTNSSTYSKKHNIAIMIVMA